MPNINLIRIDNRLFHGQVATSWIQHSKANLVLVTNDEVSTNTMRQELMKTIAPFDYINLGNSKKVLAKAALATDEKFIALQKLIEFGVKIEFQQLPVDLKEDIKSA